MRLSPIVLLTATIGTIGSNSLVLSPIAGAVAAGFGNVTPAQVMTASAIYGLAVAASALVLAPRSDKIGADRALFLALLLLTAAFASSAFAANLFLLSLSQAAAGIAAGMALPAIYGLAGHIAPKGKESQVMGRVLIGWTLSMVGGVTLSAYLTEYAGWRSVYILLTVLAALSAYMIRNLKLAVPTKKGRSTSPLTALKTPGLLPALFAVAMIGTGFYGIYNFLGAHLEQALERPVKDAGLVTLFYGTGFGLAVIFDPWLDRVGPRRGLFVLFLIQAAFYLLFSTGLGHYNLLLGLMFVWGLTQHLALNLTVGRLNALDASQRGAIMGLNSTVMYLSVFTATVLFRPIYETYGLQAAAWGAAVLALLGAGEALWAHLTRLKACRSDGPSAPASGPA